MTEIVEHNWKKNIRNPKAQNRFGRQEEWQHRSMRYVQSEYIGRTMITPYFLNT